MTVSGIKRTRYQEWVMTAVGVGNIKNKYLANTLMAILVPVLAYKVVNQLKLRAEAKDKLMQLKEQDEYCKAMDNAMPLILLEEYDDEYRDPKPTGKPMATYDNHTYH